jgi:hypothetical protein
MYIIPGGRVGVPFPTPIAQHVSGMDDGQKVHYHLEVTPQEYLFNRLQWYYLTCTFTDHMGKPKFVGFPVQFDSDITFVDGRRRSSSPNEIHNSNRIFLTISGACGSTGRELRKCTRCCEKDKARIKRKRKRDTNLSWNQTDEENNTKLIQVLTSGDEKIDTEGKIKFRLRVACCIGVNKQHHMNHYPANGSSGEREIHRGCDGMGLTVTSHGGGIEAAVTAVTSPIRILGKVTAADRQKFNDNKEPELPPTQSVFVPPRTVQQQYDTLSLPEPSFPPRAVPLAPSPQPPYENRDNWLYSIAEGDPINNLHEFASAYRKDFDRIFKVPIRKIFERDFFSPENLATIPMESPLMAQVFTILAMGASCLKKFSVVEALMKPAIRLQNSLLDTKFSKEVDSILFADSLNRTAQYYGSLGDLANAKFFNMLAINRLEALSSYGHAEFFQHQIYESIMWTRITYNLDLMTLESGFDWAKTRGRSHAMAYTLFLLIITMCNPEIKHPHSIAKIRQSIQEKHKNLFLSLYTQLTEVLDRSKYREVKDSRRNYSKLIDNGLGAIRAWALSDFPKATQHVEAAAIQSALILSPALEAFIPTYFAAFVAMQMLVVDQAKFADLAEMLIHSISRTNSFRWARTLTDFIVLTLERHVGKIDVQWYTSSQEEWSPTKVAQLLSGGHLFNNGPHFPTSPASLNVPVNGGYPLPQNIETPTVYHNPITSDTPKST